MRGTEVAARYLVLKYGLLTAHEVAKGEAYPSEQKGVELILGEIMMRTGGSRDDAIDLFLEAYSDSPTTACLDAT